MADTLTLHIDEETSAQLRRIANETGESLEDVAQRLLGEAAAEVDGSGSLLDNEQLADLDRRLRDPGPYATPEQAEAFFSRFKAG